MKLLLWVGLTVLVIMLTGCSGLPFGGKTTPAAGLTPSSAGAQTPGSDQGAALQITPESSATPENSLVLTVWLRRRPVMRAFLDALPTCACREGEQPPPAAR
jgi:hypothetical protein